MKTKKMTLSIMLLLSSWALFAQINPINDLYFGQYYDYGNSNCPNFNCFEITWSPPDNSTDTLMGYQLFQNNQNWVFTEYTNVSCLGYSPCEYQDFYDNMPFWLKVKAVYNSNSLLSSATDSVYVYDIMIGVDEIKNKKTKILQNPITAGANISLSIENFEGNACTINVYSLNGRNVKSIEVNKAVAGVVHFSSAGLSPGMYVIEVQTDGKSSRSKILIE